MERCCGCSYCRRDVARPHKCWVFEGRSSNVKRREAVKMAVLLPLLLPRMLLILLALLFLAACSYLATLGQ